MKTNEVILKIVDKLLKLNYGVNNAELLKSTIESVLSTYTIDMKETLPCKVDDVGDKIMLYLASKNIEGLSKITLKSYGRTLLRFSRSIRKNVVDITSMDIRMYLFNYSKTGVKNSTIATYTDIIRGFFSWLENEEYIPKNPMNKIKSTKVDNRMREALSKEELETLRIGATSLRQKALLEILYSTGCRLSEIENMKYRDIDWQNLSIRVIGKGNKERIVYISPIAHVHLKKYLDSRSDNSEYIFVTERLPIVGMGKRAIQKEINKINIQSGLDKNVYPHLLRHTFSTHMLNNGMDITVLQRILGHQDTSTTLIYASLNNSTIEHEYRKYS